ncbi:flagellar biosynthesis protein FlhF [Bacillus niameyensis]|uniref:flagellar biosynthesis protein FlhF n=1 Tax=Bacillus niameyensis TaxID=1522308 RepID=UPI00078487B9|nr:flagellar biosynthesis protein FlhF [Bacillus niameyensis]
MNVKKISAPTMPEVMKKVKAEMGENAVILNSKVVYKGGLFGLFRKKNVEVIAAVDEQQLPPVTIKKDKNLTLPSKNEGNARIEDKLNEKEILSEISQLKEELIKLRQGHIPRLDQYPEVIQSCLSKLSEMGLADEYVQKYGELLLEKMRSTMNKPVESDVLDWCREIIIADLNQIGFIKIPRQTKVINFVGPTGVGKTTTIAKLAAEAVLKQKKKAAFITTDTYRIAAIEQLKTYAELLKVPIEIIYEDEEFQEALQKFSDYDIVFIDTAGRNYRDKRYIEDLKKLYGNESMMTFLVLSLSMKEKDMEKIVNNFMELAFDQFIFSKADETSTFGVMYNLIWQYQIGAAYITTGQDVPDDIIKATPETIADYLIGTGTYE